MPLRTYSPVKLGTQPYNPVKVSGNNLRVGDILWLPIERPPTGTVRAYKNTPDYVSKWGRARVEKLNTGGPSGLLLSWC